MILCLYKSTTVDYAKYIGVTFDDLLLFDIHINNLAKKTVQDSRNYGKSKTFFGH